MLGKIKATKPTRLGKKREIYAGIKTKTRPPTPPPPKSQRNMIKLWTLPQ